MVWPVFWSSSSSGRGVTGAVWSTFTASRNSRRAIAACQLPQANATAAGVLAAGGEVAEGAHRSRDEARRAPARPAQSCRCARSRPAPSGVSCRYSAIVMSSHWASMETSSTRSRGVAGAGRSCQLLTKYAGGARRSSRGTRTSSDRGRRRGAPRRAGSGVERLRRRADVTRHHAPSSSRWIVGGISVRRRWLAAPAVQSRSRVWDSICSYVAVMRPFPARPTSARWNERSISAPASQSPCPMADSMRRDGRPAPELRVRRPLAGALIAASSSASRTA